MTVTHIEIHGMIDLDDDKTIDAFPAAGKKMQRSSLRARNAIREAASLRKRIQRESDRAAIEVAVFPADFKNVSTAGLLEELSRNVKEGTIEKAEAICNVVLYRTRQNKKKPRETAGKKLVKE